MHAAPTPWLLSPCSPSHGLRASTGDQMLGSVRYGASRGSPKGHKPQAAVCPVWPVPGRADLEDAAGGAGLYPLLRDCHVLRAQGGAGGPAVSWRAGRRCRAHDPRLCWVECAAGRAARRWRAVSRWASRWWGLQRLRWSVTGW